MPAYRETYLADAMDGLGEMLDFAARCARSDIDRFWKAFACTEWARAFETGSPRVLAGMSGTELAVHVGEAAGIEFTASPLRTVAQEAREGGDRAQRYALSREYWAGWALAHFQWAHDLSFRRIAYAIPMETVLRMYPTYHEESEEHAAEAFAEIMRRRQDASMLKTQRTLAGLSQSELARLSGVGIRAIQQYEQGAKDIRKAQVGNIVALAHVLGCGVEDLIETPANTYEYTFIEI